jgi:hypothetical protein
MRRLLAAAFMAAAAPLGAQAVGGVSGFVRERETKTRCRAPGWWWTMDVTSR